MASIPNKKRSSSTDTGASSKKNKTASDGFDTEPSSALNQGDFPFQTSRDLVNILPAPDPEWVPASEEEAEELRRNNDEAKDLSDRAVKCGLRHVNFELLNVNKFADQIQVRWWVKDWPYTKAPTREPTQAEVQIQRAASTLMIRGQTILVKMASTVLPNIMCASLLGFKSQQAYMTWLDTEGSDLFRGIEILRRDQWRAAATPRVFFADFVTVLNNRARYPGIHRILESVSGMTEHRTFHVLVGDVDPISMPIKNRRTTHVAATVLANVLGALKFCTMGLNSDVRRFISVEGEAGDNEPYHYGYHADLWIGMLLGGFNQFHFRRGRAILDGKIGTILQKGSIIALPYASPENLTGIRSEDLA